MKAYRTETENNPGIYPCSDVRRRKRKQEEKRQEDKLHSFKRKTQDGEFQGILGTWAPFLLLLGLLPTYKGSFITGALRSDGIG